MRKCVHTCVCVRASSESAKCRECTQLVKESGPTHLSTCADNGLRLHAYIYTLINQLGPLISQSGNLMTSHSMIGYTRGGRRQSHTGNHTRKHPASQILYVLCIKYYCKYTEELGMLTSVSVLACIVMCWFYIYINNQTNSSPLVRLKDRGSRHLDLRITF